METAILNPQVKSIDKDNLVSKFLRSDPVELVNVSITDDYLSGFMGKSKQIPLEEIDKRLNEIDKNKEVVTYSPAAPLDAMKAAEQLMLRGYRVRFYKGGFGESHLD